MGKIQQLNVIVVECAQDSFIVLIYIFKNRPF